MISFNVGVMLSVAQNIQQVCSTNSHSRSVMQLLLPFSVSGGIATSGQLASKHRLLRNQITVDMCRLARKLNKPLIPYYLQNIL